jgi:hypothetical protein
MSKDQWASYYPYRYWISVRCIRSEPIYLGGVGACFNIDASFSSRWQVDSDEHWVSDVSFSLSLPPDTTGHHWHWDFLAGEWTLNTPYNRWYDRVSSTEEAINALNGTLPFPRLPTGLPPLYSGVDLEGTVAVEYFHPGNPLSIDNIADTTTAWINSAAGAILNTPRPSSSVNVHNQLHQQMVESCHRFDSNLLLYFKDLPSVGGSLSTLLEALQNRTIQEVANVWLTQRFSDRLTWRDTKELHESMSNALEKGMLLQGRFRRSARRTTSTRTTIPGLGEIDLKEYWNSSAFFQPRESPYAIDAFARLITEWDLLSLGGLWDSVPYSFVVNWLINIQGSLDVLDAEWEKSYYSISDIWDSVKRVYDLRTCSGSRFAYNCRVDRCLFSFYSRKQKDTLRLPPFTQSLEPIGDGFHNWKHITDIGALVIQRV